MAGAGALTGALILGAAPSAAADHIRDLQWPLKAFGVDEIWQKSTGEGVTVAIIGTGVDASAPDLKGQVLEGKSFTEQGGNGQKDTIGQGTGLASIIAGQGHGANHASGVMGLAPDAKILPVKFLAHEGQDGASWDQSVKYAVDHGADVIDIPFGGMSITSEEMAIDYAIRHDVVVVAAAGNDGVKRKNYPATYPGVVSVGALDHTGSVWEDSTWGSNTTFVGPGEDIPVVSPTRDEGYALQDGTAAASAYVAASAALVRSKYPDLTQGQVINRLVETAKPLHLPNGKVPELPDAKFGYGVPRPNRALNAGVENGPESGPLPQPSPSPSSAAGVDTSDSDDSSSTDWMYVLGPPIVLFGLIFVILVVIAAILVTVVVIKKRQKPSPSRLPSGWTPPGAQPGHGPMFPRQTPEPGYQVPPQPNQFPPAPSGAPPMPHQPPPGQFGPPPPPQGSQPPQQ